MKKLSVFLCSTSLLFSGLSYGAGSSACPFHHGHTQEELQSKKNYPLEHIKAMMSTLPKGERDLCEAALRKAHDFGVPNSWLVLRGKCKAIRNMAEHAIQEQMGDSCPPKGSPEYEEALAKALAKLENPARTGIWNADGTISEEVLEQAQGLAQEDEQGRQIILKADFLNFLEEKQGQAKAQGKDVDGVATKIWWIYKIYWKKVTEGSVNELFSSAPGFEGDKAILLEDFNLFYLHPKQYMQKVRAKLK